MQRGGWPCAGDEEPRIEYARNGQALGRSLIDGEPCKAPASDADGLEHVRSFLPFLLIND